MGGAHSGQFRPRSGPQVSERATHLFWSFIALFSMGSFQGREQGEARDSSLSLSGAN